MIYGRMKGRCNFHLQALRITKGFMKSPIILAACILFFSSFSFSMERISVDISSIEANQFLSYNFGRVWLNSMNRVLFRITNKGVVEIEREGFSIGGHGYSAYTNCPRKMSAGFICDLEIRFWPAFEGSHFGRLYMLFTDKNDIIIDLSGHAYR